MAGPFFYAATRSTRPDATSTIVLARATALLTRTCARSSGGTLTRCASATASGTLQPPGTTRPTSLDYSFTRGPMVTPSALAARRSHPPSRHRRARRWPRSRTTRACCSLRQHIRRTSFSSWATKWISARQWDTGATRRTTRSMRRCCGRSPASSSRSTASAPIWAMPGLVKGWVGRSSTTTPTTAGTRATHPPTICTSRSLVRAPRRSRRPSPRAWATTSRPGATSTSPARIGPGPSSGRGPHRARTPPDATRLSCSGARSRSSGATATSTRTSQARGAKGYRER